MPTMIRFWLLKVFYSYLRMLGTQFLRFIKTKSIDPSEFFRTFVTAPRFAQKLNIRETGAEERADCILHILCHESMFEFDFIYN